MRKEETRGDSETIYHEVQAPIFHIFIYKKPMEAIRATSDQANQVSMLDAGDHPHLRKKF